MMKKLSLAVGKLSFYCKQHAPEILLGTGIASVACGTVLACRATLKAKDIVEEAKKNRAHIENVMYGEDFAEERAEGVYTEDDYKLDIKISTLGLCTDLALAYAPAVAATTLGIACIVKSNNILTKRNVALAAAYESLDKSFREYRKRVIEDQGVDADCKYRGLVKTEEAVINENGDTEIVCNTVVDPNTYSPYAKFYDESCRGWTKSAAENYNTVRCTQKYANDILQAKGYLFLNEVYEMLDIPPTPQGQIVGWKLGNGDDFVDFGIYDDRSDATRRFVNGMENVILLDFNVDGPIVNLL